MPESWESGRFRPAGATDAELAGLVRDILGPQALPGGATQEDLLDLVAEVGLFGKCDQVQAEVRRFIPLIFQLDSMDDAALRLGRREPADLNAARFLAAAVSGELQAAEFSALVGMDYPIPDCPLPLELLRHVATARSDAFTCRPTSNEQISRALAFTLGVQDQPEVLASVRIRSAPFGMLLEQARELVSAM